MSSVWVVPAGTEGHGQDGDVLVRACPGGVEVGRMSGTVVEWLGSVPSDVLVIPEVHEPTAAPELEIAVRGVESALVQRGG